MSGVQLRDLPEQDEADDPESDDDGSADRGRDTDSDDDDGREEHNRSTDTDNYNVAVPPTHPVASPGGSAMPYAHVGPYPRNPDRDLPAASCPFPSVSIALLYSWCCQNTPIGEKKMDSLLQLLQDPSFKPAEELRGITTSSRFFRVAEKHLPVSPLRWDTATQAVRNTKKNRARNRTLTRTRKIPYISIIDHIRMVMANPALRGKLLTTPWDDAAGDGPVMQFNQTPFCREPLRFSTLSSFFHKVRNYDTHDDELVEFSLGDFVQLRPDPARPDVEGPVMRMDSLSFLVPQHNVEGEGGDVQRMRTAAASEDGRPVLAEQFLTGPVLEKDHFGHYSLFTSVTRTVNAERVIAKRLVLAGTLFDAHNARHAGVAADGDEAADEDHSDAEEEKHDTPVGAPIQHPQAAQDHAAAAKASAAAAAASSTDAHTAAAAAAALVRKEVLVVRCEVDGSGDSTVYMVKRFSLKPYGTANPDGTPTPGPFLWLSVYVDKVGTANAHGKSTECVYLGLNSVDRSIYGTRDTIFTLKLLPHGTHLDPALAPERRDLQLLATKGVEVYDCQTGNIVTLRAGIAMFPADHVQATVGCRALGNSARRGGRGCSLLRVDNGNPDVDCRDHTLRRRAERTDAEAAAMQEEIEMQSLGKTARTDLRRAFGHYEWPSMYRGLACDPHVQHFWDGSHLIWFGIYPQMTKAVIEKMMGVQKVELVTRIHQLPWPSGISPPLLLAKMAADTSKSSNKGIYGQGVTMEGWRILACVSQWAYDGLADEADVKLLVAMCRLAARVFGPLTLHDVAEVQTTVRALIRSLTDREGLLAGKTNPNLHGLLEFAMCTLPAIRDATLTDCRPYETHHACTKMSMVGARSGRAGDCGERAALVWYNRRCTLRHMLGGTTWHFDCGTEMRMSPSLAGLRDPREGRGHLPHPLFASLSNIPTPKTRRPEQGLQEGAGEVWQALDAGRSIPLDGAGVREPDLSSLQASYRTWVGRELRLDRAVFRIAMGLLRVGDGPMPIIRVNDDARGTEDNGIDPAWCTVSRIWVVKEAGDENDEAQETIWVWPDWWWPTDGAARGRRGRNGDYTDLNEYTTHHVRNTWYVMRRPEVDDDSPSFPVLATRLRFQVMVLHSCVRDGGLHYRRQGVGHCTVRTACTDHPAAELAEDTGRCTVDGCGRRLQSIDYHDAQTNTWYEVFEREHGYSGATQRART